MKKIFTSIVIFFAFTAVSIAQDDRIKEAIKNLELLSIHPLQVLLDNDTNSSYNVAIKYAMDNYWNKKYKYEFISRKEFLAQAPENVPYLELVKVVTKYSSGGQNVEHYLRIYYDQNGKSHIVKQIEVGPIIRSIPLKHALILSVKNLSSRFKNDEGYKLQANGGSEPNKSNKVDVLHKSTLFISAKDISTSLTESQVKQLYPYPIKFVDDEELLKAIEGDEGTIMVGVAERAGENPKEKAPLMSRYVFNAATGEQFYSDQRGTSKANEKQGTGKGFAKKDFKNLAKGARVF